MATYFSKTSPKNTTLGYHKNSFVLLKMCNDGWTISIYLPSVYHKIDNLVRSERNQIADILKYSMRSKDSI